MEIVYRYPFLILEGVEPSTSAVVSVQNTATGGTADYVVAADADGIAKLEQREFNQNRSIHVRSLVAGKDEEKLAFMFGPDQSNGLRMIETKNYKPTAEIAASAAVVVPQIEKQTELAVTESPVDDSHEEIVQGE